MSEHDKRVEALGVWLANYLGSYSLPANYAAPLYNQTHREVAKYVGPAIADHLLDSPVMRDLLAAERAKALREAAEQHRDQFGPLGAGSRSWLLRKADRIHPADPEETR